MGKKFIKNFNRWNELKKVLDDSEKFPTINEGEVWWCSIGVNVGVEIGGKGSYYSRPVLILKKLSRDDFMGVPLTSKQKEGTWYVGFNFLNRPQTAVVGQARVMSVLRLRGKMGDLSEPDFSKIKSSFLDLYR